MLPRRSPKSVKTWVIARAKPLSKKTWIGRGLIFRKSSSGSSSCCWRFERAQSDSSAKSGWRKLLRRRRRLPSIKVHNLIVYSRRVRQLNRKSTKQITSDTSKQRKFKDPTRSASRGQQNEKLSTLPAAPVCGPIIRGPTGLEFWLGQSGNYAPLFLENQCKYREFSSRNLRWKERFLSRTKALHICQCKFSMARNFGQCLRSFNLDMFLPLAAFMKWVVGWKWPETKFAFDDEPKEASFSSPNNSLAMLSAAQKVCQSFMIHESKQKDIDWKTISEPCVRKWTWVLALVEPLMRPVSLSVFFSQFFFSRMETLRSTSPRPWEEENWPKSFWKPDQIWRLRISKRSLLMTLQSGKDTRKLQSWLLILRLSSQKIR